MATELQHDHGFASPSRRDYQLRSCSLSGEDSSRPQSPWQPTMAANSRQFSHSSSFAGRLPDEGSRTRRTRKCVSGELGRTFEAPVKARGSKSGEIVGLEIRADGIFPIPESGKKSPAPVHHMHRPSGSILWETLNDADNVESPRTRGLAIVPVPFKWEEATKSGSGEPGEVSLAVPFKWEVTPGKPRKSQVDETVRALPPLQLPPRLASAPSLKHRNSWSPCSASRYRSEEPPSRFRLEEPASRHRTNSISEEAASRHRTNSISEESASPSRAQFGAPQYQSSDYCYEDRVRSPTSTLCGPGTPSSSSSSSSYSRKPSSVSYSLESFDRWDHVSPTSRHSYAESQDSNPPPEPVLDGAIVKLRRKLNLSKPPRSPKMRAHVEESRSPNVRAYVEESRSPNVRAHVEEYYDCQQTLAAASPLRVPTEQEEEPATRLPYKMPPSSPSRVMEPPSSPTREFSHCLALPRFLTRSDSAITHWVETRNPSTQWVESRKPSPIVEDGYRSPAYKATLDLLSPSPDLLAKKSASKLRSPSTRRRHSHLVEVLCNSLKQSLQRYTKRSVVKTQSIVLYDDTFTKRHQSFMW